MQKSVYYYPDWQHSFHENDNSFRVGDILAIFYHGFIHFGIYVGNGWVIDKSRRDGCVAEVSIARFSDGNDIVNLGHTGPRTREEVVEEAYSRIGEKWELIGSNCENFYKSCQGRLNISLQVVAGVAITGVVLVACFHRK